jgi:nucleoside-diphosphate-sugar epimerase
MRVLLTGGTGYLGSNVLRTMRERGHDTYALVRSDKAAQAVTDAGAEALVGDLADVPWLTRQLAGVDGAINLAALDATGEDAVIDAAVAAFAGTAKPFVYTSGLWMWGDGADLTEESPFRSPAILAWKVERQGRVLRSGIKASAIAPAVVYGHGQGLPAGMFTFGPRTEDGALRLIGDGTQHWATVHIDDLADLYLRVLERAPGGETYIGASGVNPTVREMAEAAAGRVAPETADESRDRLGAYFADALLLDQQAGGQTARQRLGWNPTHPDVLVELAAR